MKSGGEAREEQGEEEEEEEAENEREESGCSCCRARQHFHVVLTVTPADQIRGDKSRAAGRMEGNHSRGSRRLDN